MLSQGRAAFMPKRKVWLVAWIVLVLVLLVGLRPPGPELGYDVSVWTLCGRDMNAGGLLYKDIWDHKGPLIFLLVYRRVAAD